MLGYAYAAYFGHNTALGSFPRDGHWRALDSEDRQPDLSAWGGLRKEAVLDTKAGVMMITFLASGPASRVTSRIFLRYHITAHWTKIPNLSFIYSYCQSFIVGRAAAKGAEEAALGGDLKGGAACDEKALRVPGKK